MLPRRDFLKSSSAMALGLLGLSRFTHAAASSGRAIAPYGPLVADRERLLDLPEGFSYRVLSKTGDAMSDGLKVPGKHDDMAAFPGPDGKVILVCNHELSLDMTKLGPLRNNRGFPATMDRKAAYDPGENREPPHLGGTTNIVYDPVTGRVEKQFLSLFGTDRNCSGGAMPWGTWITCEESEVLTTPRGRKHGYCFEVRATDDGKLQQAVALKALGRFRHEAVALDPDTGILYLTEDRNDGLLYRCIPREQGNFAAGGRLQALALAEHASVDLRNYDPRAEHVPEGRPMGVRWIDMEDTDSPRDDLRIRGHQAGAARFARGEGIFHADGAIYICATDGGPTRQGQIYRLLPGDPDRLELFLQPGKTDLLNNGDNLTAAPWGDLIICEDLINQYKDEVPHLRGITPEGKIYTLARNALNKSEFAGSTFSPDGSTLFVNIQNPGLTLAITGPWQG
jgi:secreted PhoX family phosphatase